MYINFSIIYTVIFMIYCCVNCFNQQFYRKTEFKNFNKYRAREISGYYFKIILWEINILIYN